MDYFKNIKIDKLNALLEYQKAQNSKREYSSFTIFLHNRRNGGNVSPVFLSDIPRTYDCSRRGIRFTEFPRGNYRYGVERVRAHSRAREDRSFESLL